MNQPSICRVSPAIALAAFSASICSNGMAQAPAAVIDAIVSSQSFEQAIAAFDADHQRFVDDLIYLTEIPSPPFKEDERAEAYLNLLRELGLSDVSMDPEGNVMGVREGTRGNAMVAVLAHLDTVFPEGTNVEVRQEGTRLFAPGVGDATRGLALMLALIRAMDAAGIETHDDILFVGNVGEEGVGDLRGTKYLLTEGAYRDQIAQFVTIDGPGDSEGQWSIVNAGVGSIRYRVSFEGPGGHSFGDFGFVNPANAMAAAITQISAISVPSNPKTTHNVGVVSGGTSVNAIPVEVFMELDMRSESNDELNRLRERVVAIIEDAVDTENSRGSTESGSITVRFEVIGDRPAGQTPASSRIAQVAAAAIKASGLEPRFRALSTDANIPMSLGIPAIGLVPGYVWRAHSLEEWTDVDRHLNHQAGRLMLATLLALAGTVE